MRAPPAMRAPLGSSVLMQCILPGFDRYNATSRLELSSVAGALFNKCLCHTAETQIQVRQGCKSLDESKRSTRGKDHGSKTGATAALAARETLGVPLGVPCAFGAGGGSRDVQLGRRRESAAHRTSDWGTRSRTSEDGEPQSPQCRARPTPDERVRVVQ